MLKNNKGSYYTKIGLFGLCWNFFKYDAQFLVYLHHRHCHLHGQGSIQPMLASNSLLAP